MIYEEKVSPNKEYVSNKKDIVHYTIKIYQEDKNTIYVYAESNSPVFENTNYSVDYNQKLSKEDIEKLLGYEIDIVKEKQLKTVDDLVFEKIQKIY